MKPCKLAKFLLREEREERVAVRQFNGIHDRASLIARGCDSLRRKPRGRRTPKRTHPSERFVAGTYGETFFASGILRVGKETLPISDLLICTVKQ
jgi:hypothetical protein